MKNLIKLCTATALLCSPLALFAEGHGDMLQMAAERGCTTCHAVETVEVAEGETKPVGPSWTSVAERYSDREDALDYLVDIVKGGSNPYDSHWKGEVSGLAMPPNEVALQEGDAEKLVAWILTLDD